MDGLRVHVWLDVLGGEQASGGQALVGEIQLDRKDHHGDGGHDWVHQRAGATAIDDPYNSYELAVDSADPSLRHCAGSSLDDASREWIADRGICLVGLVH